MTSSSLRAGLALPADDLHLRSTGVVASCSPASARCSHVRRLCRFPCRQTGRSKNFNLMLASLPVRMLDGFIRPRGTKPWRSGHGLIRAFAMEVAEEAQKQKRDDPFKLDMPSLFADVQHVLPVPPFPRNSADDVSLHNPLLRLHRMGCGWLGVIMEWDGVIVEDDSKLEREAWLALAQEEGRRPPPAFVLKKAEGMKREQAISEVLCWSRDPREMKRFALRGEEIFQELQGGIYRQKSGAREFVLTLRKLNIPVALASTKPRMIIMKAVEAVGLEGEFSCIVSAEDVYRGKPDPEMYMYAAHLLGMIPERCIVIGNSNSSIEAAHDAYMKCVAVAGKHPIYELGAADLVITRFANLSFVDLKNLSDIDSPEFRPPEPQTEVEPEVEPLPKSGIAVYDR